MSSIGMPSWPARFDDLVRHLEARFRRSRDAVIIHAEADHGRAVLLDDRQHGREGPLLTVAGVDQRLPLVDRQRGGQRHRVGRVDAQWHVGDLHDGPKHLRQKDGFIGAGHARVDVEHRRAGFHLRDGVGAGDLEVTGSEGSQHLLPARRVDTLTDDHGGLVAADLDRLGGRGDDGCEIVSHVISPQCRFYSLCHAERVETPRSVTANSQ